MVANGGKVVFPRENKLPKAPRESVAQTLQKKVELTYSDKLDNFERILQQTHEVVSADISTPTSAGD